MASQRALHGLHSAAMADSVGWKGATEGVLLTLGLEAVCHETLVGGNTHPVIRLFLFFPVVSRRKSAHGSGQRVISVLQDLLLPVGLGRIIGWQRQPQQPKGTPVALLWSGWLVGATLPVCAAN